MLAHYLSFFVPGVLAGENGERGAQADITKEGGGAMASRNRLSRRAFLKASAAGAGGLVLTASGLAIPRLLAPFGYRGDSAFADPIYIEEYPTSPLILEPFRDELPIPRALAPVPKDVYSRWRVPPDPRTGGRQDSDGVTHQLGPEALGLPEPLVYQVKLQVAEKRFTSSKVLPIDERGNEVVPPGGVRGPRHLPPSTIYGFNGTFPGPRLNAEYGKPYVVRFENHLDENPLHLDRQDFGSPQGMFLTHLHNGHTAAESDGNPHHKPEGYLPGGWSDNLYLNYPAGSDEREKQSFYWFHDHAMDQTGANVYKGMSASTPSMTLSRTTETRPQGTVCPASGPTTRTAPSTSSTTSRWPSTTAYWTTG